MSSPWPPVTDRPPRADQDGTIAAVVCAAFDAAADEAVAAVRRRARALGVRVAARPNHRPHLTLTAARVAPDAVGDVVAVAEQVAGRHEPVPVRLGAVGGFGRSGALWLGPDGGDTDALRALQRDVDRAITEAGLAPAFGGRSDPRVWVPHCTLATRVPASRLRVVERELRTGHEPVSATVAALAVILVGASGDAALLPLRGSH